MNRKYGGITADVFDDCHMDNKEGENTIVLRQIAWNLAHIADELAELNRVNSKTIKEVVDDLMAHGVIEEPRPIKGKKECFICGKPLEHDEHGGVIVDSEGDAFYSCKKCRKKFDALVAHFVFPSEVFC